MGMASVRKWFVRLRERKPVLTSRRTMPTARPGVYSLAGETADVGMDAWSPVTDDYDPWDNAFTGKIKKLTVKQARD